MEQEGRKEGRRPSAAAHAPTSTGSGDHSFLLDQLLATAALDYDHAPSTTTTAESDHTPPVQSLSRPPPSHRVPPPLHHAMADAPHYDNHAASYSSGNPYSQPAGGAPDGRHGFFTSNQVLQHSPAATTNAAYPQHAALLYAEEDHGHEGSWALPPSKKPRVVGVEGEPSRAGQAGGSEGSSSAGDTRVGESEEEAKFSAPKVKRARAASKGKGKAKGRKGGEDGEEESESEFEGKKVVKGKQRKPAGDKKKKAGRACAACQKAHLTCDDARPCARCVKKGCPDQCQDGARKKAKYLQEIPDELLERRHPPPIQAPGDENSHLVAAAAAAAAAEAAGDSGDSPSGLDALAQHNNPTTSQAFNFDTLYYDSNTYSNEFGSEAANLEYAILSSMLNGNGFATETYGVEPSPDGRGADSRMNGSANGSTMLMDSSMGLGGLDRMPVASTSAATPGSYSMFDRRTGSSATSPAGGLAFGNMMSPPRIQDTTQVLFGPLSSLKPDLSSMRSTSEISANVFSPVDHSLDAGTSAGPSQSTGTDQRPPFQRDVSLEFAGRPAQSTRMLTAEEAYRTVTKPYPYAQSYHYLVRHLKDRFEKNDILRIIRALATFRPSLIALQMPLTEEDETFVERTFQRTLVELNKLISFSGTPTVVWRRTGEICLVGTEFCLLTGWSREELLGKKYIFELFDTASVVEYYESFAKHAFESTSSSVMSQCVVLGPTGRPTPSAYSFTVRRDLFSCPFLVIGSFLPVLV